MNVVSTEYKRHNENRRLNYHKVGYKHMLGEEAAGIEPYFEDDNTDSMDQNGEFILPETLPILPLRNVVAYPGTVTPLAIGRDASRELILEAKPNNTIIGLVTQRDADIDDPDFSDIYSIGTAASILKVIKMPHGPIHVVVHALSRFRIKKPLSVDPYLEAEVEALEVKSRFTKRLHALMVTVRQSAQRVIELSPNVPEEAAVLLENIDHPSAMADFLAANLNISIQEKQHLLEESNA